MPRKAIEFNVEPNWHLDFRDTASLPEDRVVRVRFLLNTCAAAVTIILVTIVGWQLLVRHGMATQLRYWDEKIVAHDREHGELQAMLRDYMAESGKIKDAYDLIYSPFVASEFILKIGGTLPGRMTVDMIEYAEKAIIIRGSLAEPPERASRVLGHYVEALRNDPQISSLFSDISAPSLDRGRQDDLFHFQIVLNPRPTTP
jgi:hypothetical protein